MLLNGGFIDLAILCLFFFIPMPFHWVSTPSPDIASTVIQIVIFRYFIEAVYYKVNDKNRSSYIAFAAMLSAISITLKLSNIVFAFCLGVITSFIVGTLVIKHLLKYLKKKTFRLFSVYLIILLTIIIFIIIVNIKTKVTNV